MASFSSTATADPTQISSGNGGGFPPVPTDGNQEFPDFGASAPDFTTRLRRARLGLLVALTPVFMLFVSFTSAYIVRQGLPSLDPVTNTLVRDWIPVKLPPLLFFNTGILLLSSLSFELARRRLKGETVREVVSARPAPFGEGIPWLGITVALGLSFLFGQWLAWRQLASNGFYVNTAPSSSFVYLLTGAHAVHLLGGIVALLVAWVVSLFGRSLVRRFIVVDVTAWYWHFLTLLWVYILGLLEFAR